MEDLLSASEAWHSLDPKRALDDEAALRRTFDKLDLDGNGFIDPDELRVALINMQGVPPAGEQFRSRTSPNVFSSPATYSITCSIRVTQVSQASSSMLRWKG